MILSAFEVLVMVFGFLILFDESSAKCGTCSDISFASCESKTTYKPCPDGVKALDQIYQCPANTICTEKQGVCIEKGSPDAEPSCVTYDCGVCSGTNIFACMSKTEYGYCNTKGQIIASAKCNEDEVCSVEKFLSSKTICGKKCDTKPTCSGTNIVPTTPAPATIDDSFKNSCNGVTSNGYYPVKDDPTCKTYVYCESLDGVMTSVLRNCNSGYFDATKQLCTSQKPSTCN